MGLLDDLQPLKKKPTADLSFLDNIFDKTDQQYQQDEQNRINLRQAMQMTPDEIARRKNPPIDGGFLDSLKGIADTATPYIEKGLDTLGRTASGISGMFEGMVPDPNRTFDQSINPFSRAIEGFNKGYNDPNSTFLGKQDAAWRGFVGNSLDPNGPMQDPIQSIKEGWNNPDQAPDYRKISNDFLLRGNDVPYLSGVLGFAAGLSNPINKVVLESPVKGLLDSKTPNIMESMPERLKPQETPVEPLNVLNDLPKREQANIDIPAPKQQPINIADEINSIFKESAPAEEPIQYAENKARTLDKPNVYKVDDPEIEPTTPQAQIKGLDFSQWNDLSGFKQYGNTLYRNIKEAAGNDYQKLKETILDPFDTSKKNNIDYQGQLIDNLKTNIVDKLGIKKGSKESALVQQFGEKDMVPELKTLYDEGKIDRARLEAGNLEELQRKRPNDWKKIVEADKWFRNEYNQIIDKVNETRARIYPNNPEKLVPKRSDYYRHFREMNDLVGLKNLFDTPAQIDPKLVGASEFTLPKSKFAGFMQKRGLGPFKRDAVGGFLEYAPSASYAIHIDPHIDIFKGLAKQVAESTGETKHLNGVINFLKKYSQDLAGKTNPADRFLQEWIPGGRKTFGVLNWMNNRVKANTILGNLSSTIAQTANIPLGFAYAKQYAVKGMGTTLAQVFKHDITPIQESGFLKERFGREMYRQFDTRWIDQPKKAAEWVMETADRIGTNFIWNSIYEKAKAQKVSDPIKFADDETRRLIAGRGIGEVPLIQKSKVTQLVAPFTLEVANLWKVQKEFVSAKDFGGLAVLYLANYLFNQGAQQVKGSGVTFDPIQAMLDAVGYDWTFKDGIKQKEKDMNVVKGLGRLAGEVLSNVPLGQYAASLYPETGGKIGSIELPNRKQLFGKNDPSRYGTGLAVEKAIQDPFFKMVLPWGGNQIQKTEKGIDAIYNKGSYKKDFFDKLGSSVTSMSNKFADKTNELNYPVNPNLLKGAQAVAFGPNATSEAQQYFDNQRRPLSEEQTAAYEKSSNPQKFYDNLMMKRKVDSIERKIDDVKKDKKLSSDDKKEQLKKLLDDLKEAKKR